MYEFMIDFLLVIVPDTWLPLALCIVIIYEFRKHISIVLFFLYIV